MPVCLPAGCPVTHAVQHQGEIIVTWPAVLQCSFHHGWTLSESVMFATADWLPFGIQAMYAPLVVSLMHC